MGSFRVFNQRTGRLATLAALVTATLVQGLVPVFASADQVTSRSVALSSSTKAATGVTYEVKFTPVKSGAGAFAIFFCDNTPLIGQTCSAPSGLVATAAASVTPGFTGVTSPSPNKVVVAGTITAGTPVDVVITGIDNPTAAEQFYARIVTYNTQANATSEADNGTDAIDSGSVALATTDTVGVSGSVLETMSFCVAGNAITANCDLTGNVAPTLKLGTAVGTQSVLDSSTVYSGTIYTQISTNAASGAVVSLKSSATSCGGLLRAGAPAACDIPASGAAGDVVAATAGFGVKLGAATGTSGTYQAASATYDTTHYRMNYVAGNATGVTSVYGDPILNTAGGVVNNMNMPLTFGAAVSNNTPAGTYSANLSLIATGTF